MTESVDRITASALTSTVRSSIPVPFVLRGTERVSNSVSCGWQACYVERKREYCYEEGSFRGGNPARPSVSAIFLTRYRR